LSVRGGIDKEIDPGDGCHLLTHRWTGRDDSIGGAFPLDPGAQARHQARSLDFSLGCVERTLANIWNVDCFSTKTYSNCHRRARFNMKSGWRRLKGDSARDDRGGKHAGFFHRHFETEVMHPLSRLFQGLLNEVGHRKRTPVNGVYQRKPEHNSSAEQEEQGGQKTFRHRRKP